MRGVDFFGLLRAMAAGTAARERIPATICLLISLLALQVGWSWLTVSAAGAEPKVSYKPMLKKLL